MRQHNLLLQVDSAIERGTFFVRNSLCCLDAAQNDGRMALAAMLLGCATKYCWFLVVQPTAEVAQSWAARSIARCLTFPGVGP